MGHNVQYSTNEPHRVLLSWICIITYSFKCFIASLWIQKIFNGDFCYWSNTHFCISNDDSYELYVGAHNKNNSWFTPLWLVSSVIGCLGSMGTRRRKVSIDNDWICWRNLRFNWRNIDRWCHCGKIWMARFILYFRSDDFIMGNHMVFFLFLTRRKTIRPSQNQNENILNTVSRHRESKEVVKNSSVYTANFVNLVEPGFIFLERLDLIFFSILS